MTTATQHSHIGPARRLVVIAACVGAFFGLGGIVTATSATAGSPPAIRWAPATPTATTSSTSAL